MFDAAHEFGGWDPAAERFSNCEEANQLLDRPRRRGYELPEIG